eukprot:evm.model.scf_401.11 EVM.evm.TU.scf_401.11   scf_401:74890-79799(-)
MSAAEQGKVKQIVGSTLRDLDVERRKSGENLVTNFVSENPPSWFSDLYHQDGLTGGHVIMLGPDEENRSAACSALSAWPGGLQVGGGITTELAPAFLDAGASHVIVTSYVFRDGRLDKQRLRQLVDCVGRERIVLDLSCRFRDGNYWVVTDRWQRFSELAVTGDVLEDLSASCSEFLVHGVDVEGKQCGVDEQLVGLLAECCPLPVTYAGGVRDMDDLDLVKHAGRGRVDVTVGSALDIFGGSLRYADVVRWHNESQREAAVPQQS